MDNTTTQNTIQEAPAVEMMDSIKENISSVSKLCVKMEKAHLAREPYLERREIVEPARVLFQELTRAERNVLSLPCFGTWGCGGSDKPQLITVGTVYGDGIITTEVMAKLPSRVSRKGLSGCFEQAISAAFRQMDAYTGELFDRAFLIYEHHYAGTDTQDCDNYDTKRLTDCIADRYMAHGDGGKYLRHMSCAVPDNRDFTRAVLVKDDKISCYLEGEPAMVSARWKRPDNR